MRRVHRKQFNRERLLEQGVQMLMERGYHGTGIKEILESVDIPKGSFYNYFSSKENFGAEVIRHYIEPFIRQLDEFLKRPDLDPLAALELYFNTLIEQLVDNEFKGGCLLGNLMGEIGDTSPTCRIALQEAVHKYRDKIQQAIEQGQLLGSIPSQRPSQALADLIVDYWQGALLRMKIEQSDAPLKNFMNFIFNQALAD